MNFKTCSVRRSVPAPVPPPKPKKTNRTRFDTSNPTPIDFDPLEPLKSINFLSCEKSRGLWGRIKYLFSTSTTKHNNAMRCLRENPQTPTLYATAEKIAPKSTAWRFAFESARLSLFSKNPQAADELLTQKDYLLNSPEMFYLSATTFYEKGSFIFCYEQCLDYFAVHKHNKLTPKFIALSELALAKCRETKLEEHQLKQLAELTPPHVIFGKGAEEDHVNTLLNLANCYKYQINDLDNPKEQTRLFLLAAEKGDADAQYEVGQAYLNGTGLPTNEKKAMHWLKTASKNGHEQAKKELKSAKKAAASE